MPDQADRVPGAGLPPLAPLTYAAAGVDIDAGERAVQLMGPMVASTSRPEVIGGIGSFGGLFALPAGYREPVLVASTDGVGTKLAVAIAAGRLGTIGVDLVAMCVDDLVCQGAEPSSSWTTSCGATWTPKPWPRSCPGWRTGAGKRAAPSWAVSWPSTPDNCRPARWTWPVSPSGSSSATVLSAAGAQPGPPGRRPGRHPLRGAAL